MAARRVQAAPRVKAVLMVRISKELFDERKGESVRKSLGYFSAMWALFGFPVF